MRTATNTSNGTRYQSLIDVANTRSSSKCCLIFQHIINIDDPDRDQEPETPTIMRPIRPFSSKRKRSVSDHDIAPFRRVRIRNIPVQNSVLPVFQEVTTHDRHIDHDYEARHDISPSGVFSQPDSDSSQSHRTKHNPEEEGQSVQHIYQPVPRIQSIKSPIESITEDFTNSQWVVNVIKSPKRTRRLSEQGTQDYRNARRIGAYPKPGESKSMVG